MFSAVKTPKETITTNPISTLVTEGAMIIALTPTYTAIHNDLYEL